jgi:hypothetical protein
MLLWAFINEWRRSVPGTASYGSLQGRTDVLASIRHGG